MSFTQSLRRAPPLQYCTVRGYEYVGVTRSTVCGSMFYCNDAAACEYSFLSVAHLPWCVVYKYSSTVLYCTVLYCSCLVSLQPKIDTVNERDISEYCVLPVYSPVYRYNDNHNNNSSILFVHSLHSFDALYCTRIYTVSYSFSYSYSYSYSYSFSFGSVSVVT
jgi:hypothetical protein